MSDAEKTDWRHDTLAAMNATLLDLSVTLLRELTLEPVSKWG
jgi:hypothetical protein